MVFGCERTSRGVSTWRGWGGCPATVQHRWSSWWSRAHAHAPQWPHTWMPTAVARTCSSSSSSNRCPFCHAYHTHACLKMSLLALFTHSINLQSPIQNTVYLLALIHIKNLFFIHIIDLIYFLSHNIWNLCSTWWIEKMVSVTVMAAAIKQSWKFVYALISIYHYSCCVKGFCLQCFLQHWAL